MYVIQMVDVIVRRIHGIQLLSGFVQNGELNKFTTGCSIISVIKHNIKTYLSQTLH